MDSQQRRQRAARFDAYSPAEIAERVESEGVRHAAMPLLQMAMLGVVGGGFIGLGAMTHTAIVADPDLNAGAARVLGSVAYAMGYLVAITAGASVFTTNVLMVMTWVAGKIRTPMLLRSWSVVLVANAVGACGLVLLVIASGQAAMYDGAVGVEALRIGAAKSQEPLVVAMVRGMLGNLLVCVAAWVAMSGRSTTDKMIAPLLPVAALKLGGFEHSVGNLYYLPMAAFLAVNDPAAAGGLDVTFSMWGAARNLIGVIIGNIIGGTVLVGMVYHLAYRRGAAA